MRVNHVGEVCARALYQGQALTARRRSREALDQAAREEEDHLAWSAERIRELGGRPSLLNPLWYAGSFAIGAAAGLLGDRWSSRVPRRKPSARWRSTSRVTSKRCRPKTSAPARWSKRCAPTRARHRASAIELGAAELPDPVKRAMRLTSRVMTTVAYGRV